MDVKQEINDPRYEPAREQWVREYDKACADPNFPCEQQLPLQEQARLEELPMWERMALPKEVLYKYMATAKWLASQRFAQDGVEGMSFGGMSFDEVLAEARAAKGQAPNTSSS